MTVSDKILGVIALVCFSAATIGWPKIPLNLVALGLALLTAAWLF